MHAVEQKILQCFAKTPGRDISTTELVKNVFSEEYEELKKYIHNEQKDREVERIGRRRKARLHRKILYHLNKLTEEKILKITRTEGKGEKFFIINPDKESPGAQSKREKVISKVLESVSTMKEDEFILSGLESYEEDKVVKRFDSMNWISKINSFIIESGTRRTLKELYSMISELYPVYNDVIGLNDFNIMVDNEDMQELNSFIKKINIDTKDYNKYINIIIDLSKIKDSVKLTDFVSSFSEINPEKVFMIFRTDLKSLGNHTRFMKQLVKNFSEHKIRINLQNTDLKKAPMMIGRAGTYTFEDSEWEKYLKNVKGKTIGLCSSETSLYVDVYRFFKEKRSYSEFRDFILKAARALLMATTTQRKKSDLLFKTLNEENSSHQNKFFSSSFNYIRLWNYDLPGGEGQSQKELEKYENFEAVLKVCQDEINEFCRTEETIFKSCGIPIRFKVVLSSAFKRFDLQFLSPRIYKKITIKGLNDFHAPSFLEYIKKRERLANIFEGGDRVRFFRASSFTQDETLSEFSYLLANFNIPLLAYDFNARKGELTLDNFI